MTLAYGSAEYGFYTQIYSDTTKRDPIFNPFRKPAARYMAKLIWDTVGDVVVSAVSGMRFLRNLAQELVKADLPVAWVTPLGLPIQQAYLQTERKSFRTRLGSKMSMPLYYEEILEGEHVHPREQRNGIAPNFIHSLDACHLMMVVLDTNFKHYTTVHDSFGTTLANASKLRVSIREQLYKLYTEYKPFETFKASIEDKLERKVDVELPQQGNLDLKEILKSTYVFH